MEHISSVPALGRNDKYHAFISHSSRDSIWVSGLIYKLQETFPGVVICSHERDFIPGKPITENMVDCIQSSQKIIMVLSPDFVQSRWCLFEANLSVFQDCMMCKAIVPIMLKPCPVPLHLSHLTYLEADDEQFFDKLSRALLSNNETTNSTLIHYQPSFLYNGKTLLSLSSVNEEQKNWLPGVFSSISVPDSLRAVVDDPKIYKEAIEKINDIPVSFSIGKVPILKLLVYIITPIFSGAAIGITGIFLIMLPWTTVCFHILTYLPILTCCMILIPTLFIKMVCWKLREFNKVFKDMKKRTGEANLILNPHFQSPSPSQSLLAGCLSTKQLQFVYLSLHQCMQTFHTTFGHDSALASEMWEQAIITYSSDYACCVAKKHFPFNFIDLPGHLENGICFCQYVAIQLQMDL